MGTQFLAGWSAADISPVEPVLIAGQFHARVSEGVSDPVTATVLAIEADTADAVTRCLLISCDLVGIPEHFRIEVRKAICRHLPVLKPEEIVLNATHTHTAPEVRQAIDAAVTGGGNVPPVGNLGLPAMEPAEYISQVAEKIAVSACEAWERREPSGIAFGLGQAVVGHNRRLSYLNGESVMYGDASLPTFSHVEGFEDHSMNLLAVWNARQELTGLIINLACPSQATENLFTVSADFWHEARLELRRRLGQKVYILPQCSAAGDQSPRTLVGKAAAARMLRLQGRTEREEIGRRIADAVTDILPDISKEIAWAPRFAHICEKMEVERRKLTEQDAREAIQTAAAAQQRYEAIQAELAAHPEKKLEKRWYVDISREYRRMVWNREVEERYKSQQTRPVYPLELHILRIGDVAMATNPFEYYLDYGLRIKGRSPAVQTFVVQLAGGGTYLPTARTIPAKGYGSIPAGTLVGPEGGEAIVERTLATLQTLWA